MSISLAFNPGLQTLPVYQPGRPIEEVARELGRPLADIIKMASNENPLGPSPAGLAALQHALPQLHLYPDGNAFYLKQALAKKLGLGAEHLVLGNGSNELIEFIGHALLGPGDDVVVSQYCFAVYPIVTRLFGANLITVPAQAFGHNLAAMRDAITPRTKLVFVANPNNPTGTLAARASVLDFIRDVPPGVLLVMDEAYIDFLEDPVDLIPLVREKGKPNLILLRTFSKIYGLAGLRLGFGVGHPEVIAVLEKIRQPFNTNALAQIAALAALEDFEHLHRTKANNLAGLRFFVEGFRRLRLEFIPSHANFICVRVGDGPRIFDALQKAGVIVRPLGVYQMPEWLRITVGTPAENARCLAALEKAMTVRENP
jgi:histidinol-phosphate aminotransferase